MYHEFNYLDSNPLHWKILAMDVDDESEISFSIHQRTFPWQRNVVGFSACVSLDAGG